ncbi:hypothetical protein HYH03_006698 [Edaphochlamys debaryana]|uniref:Uncharacterized protein n=1 Tax=Edaphochlamys debaryana TaxID=47281 RepID=A0A836C0N9_9CHLO|nr:hypothetical protein HYH03_006698 [Edaphochlamys debaryana]|eukprot:KAG2495087.1 hypothetical protein HYH03_006698 [Edaphochlamys debaryana]
MRCGDDGVKGLSHWSLMLPDMCGTLVSSPNGGEFKPASQPDPTTCAVGYKWDPSNFESGTRYFILKVQGNWTDPDVQAQYPFAVKGSTRNAWSNITDGAAASTVTGPTCCNRATFCCGESYPANPNCPCDDTLLPPAPTACPCVAGDPRPGCTCVLNPTDPCCVDPASACCLDATSCACDSDQAKCCDWTNHEQECCDAWGSFGTVICTTPDTTHLVKGTLKWSIGANTPYTCGNAAVYDSAAQKIVVKLVYDTTFTTPAGAVVTDVAYAVVDDIGEYTFTTQDIKSGSTATVTVLGIVNPAAPLDPSAALPLPGDWSAGPAGGMAVTIVLGSPTTGADTTVARTYSVTGDVYVLTAPPSPLACATSTARPGTGLSAVTVAAALPDSYSGGVFSADAVVAPSTAVATVDAAVAPVGTKYTASGYTSTYSWTYNDFFRTDAGADVDQDNRCLGTLPPACLNVGLTPVDVIFSGPINWAFKAAAYACSSVTVELRKASDGAVLTAASTSTGAYTLTVSSSQLQIGATYDVVITAIATPGSGVTVSQVVGSVTSGAYDVDVTSYTLEELTVTRTFDVTAALRYDLRSDKSAPPVCANLADGFPALSYLTLSYTDMVALDTASGASTTTADYGDAGSMSFVVADPATRLVALLSSVSFDSTLFDADLCAGAYPLCLSVGCSPISVTGEIEWSFPDRPSFAPPFTCEPVQFALAMGPTPLGGGTQTQAADGTFSFAAIPDIKPGTVLTVSVASALQSSLYDFVAATTTQTVTADMTTSTYPAAAVQVTREFTVTGSLRYDMRTPPKAAFVDSSCASSTRADFNIPDWSPLFPATTYAKVCVGDDKCTDSTPSPLVLSADGIFTVSGIALSDDALTAQVSAISSRIDDDAASFRTQSPDLMALFMGTTLVDDVEVPNLCLADVPVCLTVGVRPIQVEGNVEWSFPSRPAYTPGFACEEVDLSLTAPDLATPASSPATIATTVQSLVDSPPVAVGDFAFGTLDRIPPDTALSVAAASLTSTLYAFAAGTATVTVAVDASTLVASPVKVTRTFPVAGTLRYNLNAQPSPADTCASLDAFGFPEAAYATVYVGAQVPANAQALSGTGTFATTVALGMSTVNAAVVQTAATDMLDLDESKYNPSDELTALFMADLCAASYPVCLHVGIFAASVCGKTKWELNGDTAVDLVPTGGSVTIETRTTCMNDDVVVSSTAGSVGALQNGTPSGNDWCFTVTGATPGSTVTLDIEPDAGDPYTVYSIPASLTLTQTTTVFSTPLYVTRKFEISGFVDFDFTQPAPLADAACPATHVAPTPDDAVKVTSTLTTGDIYAAATGKYTIPEYQFSTSSVTVDLAADASTPAYFLIGSPYHIQRVLSAADLAKLYGSADLCTTGAIPAPCLTLGKKTAPLTGRIWIEIDEPKSTTVSYTAPPDLTFDCAISVTIEAIGSGSGIVVNNAVVTSTTVIASRTDGSFSATVIQGGDYAVTAQTFTCEGPEGHNTTGLAPYYGLVSSNYPNPATADQDNGFHVDFPYLANYVLPTGCGHTLGFWKTNAERVLQGRKTQYNRPEYLPILQSLVGYVRPDVLNVLPSAAFTTYMTNCRLVPTTCADNWYFQYVINTLGSTSAAPLDLLYKQLLANEISFKAGYVPTQPFVASVNHVRAEFMAYQYGIAKTSLFTSNDVLAMQKYLDDVNNLSPAGCDTDVAAPSVRRHAMARRLAMN